MIQTYVHYYYCYYCYYYSITHKNLVSVGHMFLKLKLKSFVRLNPKDIHVTVT